MADVMSKEQRSRCMSRIRGKDTKPEITVRKALWGRGHRYRLQYELPGRPDFVFVQAKVAVFIDGCFWHRCPKHFVRPKSNRAFWLRKLNGNVIRDRKINRELKKLGWEVVRCWEHQVEKSCRDVVLLIERKVLGTHRAPNSHKRPTED
jgi:DNA mismatch endonuclease, patch repair protein